MLGMALLVGGLALFIGVHLIPMLPRLRAGLMERLGGGPYRGLFSLASIAGVVLIVMGYGRMQGLGRGNPELWVPPVWIRHVVLLLMIPSMILPVAARALAHPLRAPPDAGGARPAFAPPAGPATCLAAAVRRPPVPSPIHPVAIAPLGRSARQGRVAVGRVVAGACGLRADAGLGTRQAHGRAAAAVSAGRVIAIARRQKRRAPMQEIADGIISVAAGLPG
jgi:hypothetical protein